MLECSNGKYYTGSTNNLVKRLDEHQQGLGANFTKKFLPVRLVYVEIFGRIDTCFAREKQIQGWSHQKKKALILGNKNNLRLLAECQNITHCNNILTHGLPENLQNLKTHNDLG